MTIDEIQRCVAHHYNLTGDQLLRVNRGRRYSRPRQVAMYLTRTLTGKSLEEIGRKFGDRDHTTVLYAVRRIDELTKTDADTAQDVRELAIQLQKIGVSRTDQREEVPALGETPAL